MAFWRTGQLLALILTVLCTISPAAARAEGVLPDSVTAPVAEAFSGNFYALTDKPPYAPTYAQLYDMTDNAVPWSALYGKIVLINFWATWCPSCLVELPALERLRAEKQGADFAVVYVSVDFPDDGASLRKIMSERKLPELPTYYIKDTRSWQMLDLAGVPLNVLLDRRGRPVYRMLGDADWDSAPMRAFIDAAIGLK
jgi:thiol-disulfide isomerase/thioredoxin